MGNRRRYANSPYEERHCSPQRDDFPPLDAIDHKIISELSTDGRISFAELGRRTNLSSPAVTERVKRLEQAGVITGYRAEVDPRALGYQLTAIVRVKPAVRQLAKIAELAARDPADRGVPADHRRGLLLHQAPPRLDRGAPERARPVPALRRDHDLDRQRHPGAAPGPATALPLRVKRLTRNGLDGGVARGRR